MEFEQDPWGDITTGVHDDVPALNGILAQTFLNQLQAIKEYFY